MKYMVYLLVVAFGIALGFESWPVMAAVLGLVTGFFLSLFCLYVILFPVFYYFPKAVGLVFKGVLRPVAILKILMAPFMGTGISFLIAVAYREIAFFRNCADAIASSGISIKNPFAYYTCGIIVLSTIVFSVFSKRDQLDVRQRFWKIMNNYRKIVTALQP